MRPRIMVQLPQCVNARGELPVSELQRTAFQVGLDSIQVFVWEVLQCGKGPQHAQETLL